MSHPQYGVESHQSAPGQSQVGYLSGAGTPAPTPKKKNWFLRHKLLTALGAILLLIVLGSALGGGKHGEQQAAPAVSSNAENTNGQQGQNSPPAEAKPAAGIGSTVTSGDFAITVTSVEPGQAMVGNSALGKSAQGEFVFVHVKVTNNGKKADTFTSSLQKLVDGQGREFEADGAAAIYLGDNGVLLKEINPGNSVEGVLVYDLPKGTTPEKAVFQAGYIAKKVEVSLK